MSQTKLQWKPSDIKILLNEWEKIGVIKLPLQMISQILPWMDIRVQECEIASKTEWTEFASISYLPWYRSNYWFTPNDVIGA